MYAAHFGTYCRRRKYMQEKNFILATIYALRRQYVPRILACSVAGYNMCRGDTICPHKSPLILKSIMTKSCKNEHTFRENKPPLFHLLKICT